MKFGTRLFLGAVGILVVATAGLLVAADHWLHREMEATLTRELEHEARLIGINVARGGLEYNFAAHRFGALLGQRVTFVDLAGKVLGDSDFDDASLALLENHATRPEIVAAFAHGVGTSRRYSESTDRMELKVAVATGPGIVRISAPLDGISAAVHGAQVGILIAALVTLLFGSGLAMIGARTVGGPVRRLADAARAVAAGGTPRFPPTNIPELRELTFALRAMDEELEGRIVELRREREEMQTLLASTAEGIIASNERGEISVCNAAARQLLGFTAEALLPPLPELFHQREARELVDRVISGESVSGREVSIGGRELLVTARPLPGGGAVLGLLNITDLKRLQAARRDFVANVSHELKTPLTSIVGYAETLRTSTPDEQTARRFLETLHGNAVRMQRLVDDLLDLARLESGTWEPTRVAIDVGAVARDAWEAYAARAAERDIELSVDVPGDLTCNADRDALRQVFANLFDNALRHTPDGGKIDVRAKRADGTTEIAVTDTGSGIPSEHVARVFERFYRVDPARSREEGGTGLGLSIVKHIVEAHGGSVAIESALGRGTTVTFALPAG